jgi:hypothetical protein
MRELPEWQGAPPLRVRQSYHRAAQRRPRRVTEGGWWGNVQAVGRETGSLLRLLRVANLSLGLFHKLGR